MWRILKAHRCVMQWANSVQCCSRQMEALTWDAKYDEESILTVCKAGWKQAMHGLVGAGDSEGSKVSTHTLRGRLANDESNLH